MSGESKQEIKIENELAININGEVKRVKVNGTPLNEASGQVISQ